MIKSYNEQQKQELSIVEKLVTSSEIVLNRK